MDVIEKTAETETPPLDICPVFHTLTGTRNALYKDIIRSSLEDIIPALFFDPSFARLEKEEQKNFFEQQLPLINKRIDPRQPLDVALFLINESRPSVFHFFFTMVSSWLNPGKRVNVGMLNATDFTFSRWPEKIYTICEIVVSFTSVEERDRILSNLPHLVQEITLGATSSFYAQKILEIKALSVDAQTASIHEKIVHLIERFPHTFGQGLFEKMQRTLVLLEDSFKAKRCANHLSRMIALIYLLSKEVSLKSKQKPQSLVLCRLYRSKLRHGQSFRPTLSVVVVCKKSLEERQIVDALRQIVGDVDVVPDSYFSTKNPQDHLLTSYIEISRSTCITGEELNLLREELPKILTGQAEGVIYPVFMPRNEEEIMRHILQLASEIRYVKDIPHVILSFEEQTQKELIYNVILSRVVTSKSKKVTELFAKSEKNVHFTLDTLKEMGPMRSHYTKESYLLRAHLQKQPFLRRDLTIDLYKARDAVLGEITNALGPIRDFNGGMISREKQIFKLVRKEVEAEGHYNELLLENLFYTMDPPVMRTLANPHLVSKLYHLMNKHLNKRNKTLEISFEEEGIIAITKVSSPAVKKEIQKGMRQNGALKSEFGLTLVKRGSDHYLGMMLLSHDQDLKEALLHLLK